MVEENKWFTLGGELRTAAMTLLGNLQELVTALAGKRVTLMTRQIRCA